MLPYLPSQRWTGPGQQPSIMKAMPLHCRRNILQSCQQLIDDAVDSKHTYIEEDEV